MPTKPEDLLDTLLTERHPLEDTRRWRSGADADLAALIPLVQVADRLDWVAGAMPSPTFARSLEARMLARAEEVRHAGRVAPMPTQRRTGHARVLRWAAAAAAVCLVGVGTLTAAASAGPGSPLSGIGHLEEVVRLQVAQSPESRAQVHIGYARQALVVIAGGASGTGYSAALTQLADELSAAQQDLASMPAGATHDHLASQLASVQAQARQVLLDRLTHLGWANRLATTRELGTLGADVPTIAHVVVHTPPSAPSANAASNAAQDTHIEISGTGFLPGATLYINGQPVTTTLTVTAQNIGAEESALPAQQITSIGVSNPDGTAVSTTVIVSDTGTSGTTPGAGAQGTPDGKGNGHGKDATPTPGAQDASPTPRADPTPRATHTPH